MSKTKDYTKLYRKADTEAVFNEDKDLEPIHVPLPSPPDITTIDGYGLHPSEQYFRKTPMPAKLVALEKERYYRDPMKDDAKPIEYTPRLKIDSIERNAEYYADEIAYIQREWERRENGYWFFNNGKPTYITGDHYFYLTAWTIDGRNPQFRQYDRRFFIFAKFCIDDDNCYGMTDVKCRRVGDTNKISCLRWNRASQTPYMTTGLQSKTETDAEMVHERMVRIPGKRVPFFFQPIQYGRQNLTSEIRFFTPESRLHPDFGYEGLESLMDYRDSGVKAYDGSKQWINHQDEAGKLEDIDINDRHDVLKPCLEHLDPNKPIKGKAFYTSTVAEMEKGGGTNFKRLCEKSHYHKCNDNGQTVSGLYNLFMSALEGIEGYDPKTKEPFIDKHGEPRRELIEKYLVTKREAARKAGDIKGYIEICRQYPLSWADCWKNNARDCWFNLAIIEDRLEFFRNGNPLAKQGNFIWTGEPYNSKVRFEPSDTGRFWLSWDFKDPGRESNRYNLQDGIKTPLNTRFGILGGDPYKKTKAARDRDGSKGGIAGFMKYDHAVDGNRKMEDWTTNRFFLTYSHRPPTKEAFGDDCIMACQYFGIQMFPEINVDFIPEHFEKCGYGGYLLFKFDRKKGEVKDEPGMNTQTKSKQQIYALTESYIENHGHRECHPDLLQTWKDLGDDLGPFDLAVAAGYALMGAEANSFTFDDFNEEVDLAEIFSLYELKDDGTTEPIYSPPR